MKYFISRDSKVSGPFSKQQIRAAIKSKKLSKTDLLGTSANGPWRTVESEAQNKQGNASAGETDDFGELLPAQKKRNAIKRRNALKKSKARETREAREAEKSAEQSQEFKRTITKRIAAGLLVVFVGPVIYFTITALIRTGGSQVRNVADSEGEDTVKVVSIDADPVKNFESILFPEWERNHREFQTKINTSMYTYKYVRNSLKIDVKKTDSLVNKYEAYMEFKATETKDGKEVDFEPEYWKFKFLHDGTDWRVTEYTLFGNVPNGGTFHEVTKLGDFLRGHLGIVVKNIK